MDFIAKAERETDPERKLHLLKAAEGYGPGGMGLPDTARAVYRASQRPYRAMFESVWGLQAFAIAWPGDIDRGRAGTTFDQGPSSANFTVKVGALPFVVRALPGCWPFRFRWDFLARFPTPRFVRLLIASCAA
jgi:hypothetical protein